MTSNQNSQPPPPLPAASQSAITAPAALSNPARGQDRRSCERTGTGITVPSIVFDNAPSHFRNQRRYRNQRRSELEDEAVDAATPDPRQHRNNPSNTTTFASDEEANPQEDVSNSISGGNEGDDDESIPLLESSPSLVDINEEGVLVDGMARVNLDFAQNHLVPQAHARGEEHYYMSPLNIHWFGMDNNNNGENNNQDDGENID